MSKDDPTKPEFFGMWSTRQMQVELARLNQLLKEVSEIAENKEVNPKELEK